MNVLEYYRTCSHPEIWEDFLNVSIIPDGYELKEKPEHRKKRLEQEQIQCEKQLEYFKNELVRVQEKLDSIKKELKE
jgi:hypothetical protein